MGNGGTMTDGMQKASEEFLREIIDHEVNIRSFFTERGMEIIKTDFLFGAKSPLFVHDGSAGTVIPPIGIRLPPRIAWRTIPNYFDGENDDLVIQAADIVTLPELECLDGEWVLTKRGNIKQIR